MTGWLPAWRFDPPSGHPSPVELADGLAVLNEPGGARWRAQLERTGGCAHPILLSGRVRIVDRATGELATVYDTADEPRGVALVACKTRRAAVCPACAELYRGDAYQLLTQGLIGAKAGRPALFLTLTAPSFGPVHAHRGGRPCRPRAASRRCIHGRPVGCSTAHRKDDPAVGSSICRDCADPAGTVLFNACAPDLWRRTSTGIRRAIAHHVGLPRRRLSDHVRLSFVKVAEFQRRGVIHYHVIARLDPPGDQQRLDTRFSVALLAAAVTDAVRKTRLPMSHQLPETLVTGSDGAPRSSLGWGTQLHLQPLTIPAEPVDDQPEDDETSGHRPGPTGRSICGYLAKYATKGCEDLGLPYARLPDGGQPPKDLPEHIAALVTAARSLGDVPGLARAAALAGQLGYRGHFLTKSRSYSATFAALRARRREWTATHRLESTQAQGAPTNVELTEWRYAGRGHHRPGDRWLAQLAADQAKSNRLAVRDARIFGDLQRARAA